MMVLFSELCRIFIQIIHRPIFTGRNLLRTADIVGHRADDTGSRCVVQAFQQSGKPTFGNNYVVIQEKNKLPPGCFDALVTAFGKTEILLILNQLILFVLSRKCFQPFHASVCRTVVDEDNLIRFWCLFFDAFNALFCIFKLIEGEYDDRRETFYTLSRMLERIL